MSSVHKFPSLLPQLLLLHLSHLYSTRFDPDAPVWPILMTQLTGNPSATLCTQKMKLILDFSFKILKDLLTPRVVRTLIILFILSTDYMSTSAASRKRTFHGVKYITYKTTFDTVSSASTSPATWSSALQTNKWIQLPQLLLSNPAAV